MLTPGEILQKRRKALRKSLNRVSQETRIQQRFLESLERDDFSAFPSNVFANGFIKIYSEYLGLDVEKMLALYRRASNLQKIEEPKGKKRLSVNFKSLLTPVNIVWLIIVSALVIGFIYLNTQYYKFQKAPEFSISTPKDSQVIESSSTQVLGIADINSKIYINDEVVPLNPDGSFKYTLDLNLGNNVIIVKAINENNSQQETVKTLNIQYVKPQAQKDEGVQDSKQTHKAYIEIVDSEAWIKFVVDDTQKYAQVLQVGKSETFEVKESLEVVSGRPTSTRLYIDGKRYELNINTQTGVASISCTIDGGSVNCSQ